MAEAPFNTPLIVDLFDARNDPASIAEGFLQFQGDPERTSYAPPSEFWQPLTIVPDSMAFTDETPDTDPPGLKAQTVSALLAAAERVSEGADNPMDTVVGIDPVADRWGFELVNRIHREVRDRSSAPASSIISRLSPSSRRVLLVSNVLSDGRREVSAINQIRENEGPNVVGVVAVADTNRGGPDHIAAETDVRAIGSVISAVGIFVSLFAAGRIGPDYAAFGLRWANDTRTRTQGVLSKDQVPFSTP